MVVHCRKGLVSLSLLAAVTGFLAVSVTNVMIGCGPTVKELRIPAKRGLQIKHMFAARMTAKGLDLTHPPTHTHNFTVCFALLTRKSGGYIGRRN